MMQRQVKTRLLPNNPLNKAIINFSTFLNVAMLALAILLPSKKKHASSKIAWLFKHTKQGLFAIALLLEIHDLLVAHAELNYQAEGVRQELSKSWQSLQMFSKPKHRVTLNAVTTHKDNPSKVSYLKEVIANKQKKKVKISWQVGQGQILEQANNVKNIFDELALLLPVEKLALPEFPKILNERRKYFPYMTQVKDFPSKVRALNHYTLLAFVASESMYRWLKERFNLSIEHRYLLYFASIAIQWPTNLLDSYVRTDNSNRLNLEGYTHKYPSYSVTQNCITQQLNQKFVFYPDNPAMNAVIKYIMQAKQTLDQLIDDEKLNDIEISDDLRSAIDRFNEIFHEENDIATIDFNKKPRML